MLKINFIRCVFSKDQKIYFIGVGKEGTLKFYNYISKDSKEKTFLNFKKFCINGIIELNRKENLSYGK